MKSVIFWMTIATVQSTMGSPPRSVLIVAEIRAHRPAYMATGPGVMLLHVAHRLMNPAIPEN